METTSNVETGSKVARRQRVIPPRDRAEEWEQTASVSSSTFSRTSAPEKNGGTKFLRLLNHRMILVLVAAFSVLSPTGKVKAQFNNQPATDGPGVAAVEAKAPIHLTCTNAPLDVFLKYFSQTTGYTVRPMARIMGQVTVTEDGILSKKDALLLAEKVLSKLGYGVVLGEDETLTIIPVSDSRRIDIPLFQFTRVDDIPATTNLISCVFTSHVAPSAEYAKVMTNLGLNLKITTEEDNSLIITGQALDVRGAATAMVALDHANDAATKQIELFPLKYADAAELSVIINDLFAAGGADPVRRRYSGGFAFGQNDRVFAKVDTHSNSLIVTSPEDLLPIIRELVQKLDQPAEDITEVQVFHLKNADCTDLATELTGLLSNPLVARAWLEHLSAHANEAARGVFAATNLPNVGTNELSDFMKKELAVTAVPDPRTQSLLVSASKDMMPQIEDLINSLDSIPDRSRTGHSRESNNVGTDSDVLKALQDLNSRKPDQLAPQVPNVIQTDDSRPKAATGF